MFLSTKKISFRSFFAFYAICLHFYNQKNSRGLWGGVFLTKKKYIISCFLEFYGISNIFLVKKLGGDVKNKKYLSLYHRTKIFNL